MIFKPNSKKILSLKKKNITVDNASNELIKHYKKTSGETTMVIPPLVKIKYKFLSERECSSDHYIQPLHFVAIILFVSIVNQIIDFGKHGKPIEIRI